MYFLAIHLSSLVWERFCGLDSGPWQVLYHLIHEPSPFVCFSYFSDSLLHFCLGLALDLSLFTFSFLGLQMCTAMPRLFVEMAISNFLPELA
jgi:hypothetical protein